MGRWRQAAHIQTQVSEACLCLRPQQLESQPGLGKSHKMKIQNNILKKYNMKQLENWPEKQTPRYEMATCLMIKFIIMQKEK